MGSAFVNSDPVYRTGGRSGSPLFHDQTAKIRGRGKVYGAFDGRDLAYCQKACKASEFSEKTADVKFVG